METENIKIKEPKVISPLFSDEDYTRLRNHFESFDKSGLEYDTFFGRYHMFSPEHPILTEYEQKLLPIAKEFFESDTLIPSYSLVSEYSGSEAKLINHIDSNACTYTIDMCIYQTEPWTLWVNSKPYLLNENEALAYYGEVMPHGRDPFPNPESQVVCMAFFHFVEPDHWSLNPELFQKYHAREWTPPSWRPL